MDTAVTASKDLAARRTYHARLRATPAQRVIGRDLILPRKFNTNGMIRKAPTKRSPAQNTRVNIQKAFPRMRQADKLCHKSDSPKKVSAENCNGTTAFDVATHTQNKRTHESSSEPTPNNGPLGSGCTMSDWAYPIPYGLGSHEESGLDSLWESWILRT
jgi:hypothetical protein